MGCDARLKAQHISWCVGDTALAACSRTRTKSRWG